MYAELGSPTNGYKLDNIDYSEKDESTYYKYSASKAGVYYQGAGIEFARRHKDSGILSVASRDLASPSIPFSSSESNLNKTCNPGNLKSDLQRHHGNGIIHKIGQAMLFPAINGAYTELFSGLSPEVTLDKSGSYSRHILLVVNIGKTNIRLSYPFRPISIY